MNSSDASTNDSSKPDGDGGSSGDGLDGSGVGDSSPSANSGSGDETTGDSGQSSSGSESDDNVTVSRCLPSSFHHRKSQFVVNPTTQPINNQQHLNGGCWHLNTSYTAILRNETGEHRTILPKYFADVMWVGNFTFFGWNRTNWSLAITDAGQNLTDKQLLVQETEASALINLTAAARWRNVTGLNFYL
ncbi:unnamed protein product [Cylicocyclus nassatus]|uniref:Uncharacterized protein n=1 Tax=Cylicocyclus nassatus TaxID=53992 RepID=A0AA36GNR6_CYLNA|nr:unnamed protein product [Cylicocyclus nassatus]